PSQETPRRGASGGGLAGTSGGSGFDGWSLEGVAGGASLRALLSPCRALRAFWAADWFVARIRRLEQLRAAVVADSRRRTYALFGPTTRRLLAKKTRRLAKKWHGVWPTTARLWPNNSAADSVHSPPPCGEGLGVGVARFFHRWRYPCLTASPPPPQGGREHTECAEGMHRACGNSDHATPTRSIMAASFGCGARRMAAAPAAESGCAAWP